MADRQGIEDRLHQSVQGRLHADQGQRTSVEMIKGADVTETEEQLVLDLNDEHELLLRFRPWLRRITGRFPQMMPSRNEDLAQEGWIAIWRGVQILKSRTELPSNIELWLRRCAINRMSNVIDEWKAQSRNVYNTTLVDFNAVYDEDDSWMSYLTNIALTTDLGDIELAYHHGEIMRAINELPRAQRQYVIRKFWHRWSPIALDIYFTNSRKTWSDARGALVDKLGHLVDAY